jgi:hypothetical protein
VTTDSFHGFCFSIIFKKPMIAYINERRGKARFDSIAQLTGLQNRLVSSYAEALKRNLAKERINFTAVGKILDKKIEDSKQWLKNALDAKLRQPSVKELLLWKCLEHDEKIHNMKVNELNKEINSLKERLDTLEKLVTEKIN